MRTEAATPIPHSLNLVVVGPSTEEGAAGIGGTVCSYAGAARLEMCAHILHPPNFLDAERVRRLAVGSGTAACASARSLCVFQQRWRVNSHGWYLDSDIGGASVERKFRHVRAIDDAPSLLSTAAMMGCCCDLPPQSHPRYPPPPLMASTRDLKNLVSTIRIQSRR
jgi:hypothetical protein